LEIAADDNAGGTVEDCAKAEWDKNKNLRSEFGDDYASYLAFEKGRKEGRIKILGSNK
jgi:hypothetical protein